MDPVAGMINGPRASGAFLLRSVMEPPWSLRIEDHAPLSLVTVVRGSAWVLPDAADGVLLGPGDVALVRGPGGYTVADDPATPPQVVINPDQSCTTLRGDDLALAQGLGVRTWGNDLGGSTVLLTGTYADPDSVSYRLLAALPTLLMQRREDTDVRLLDLFREEIGKDGPGQEAVLDRLLDLVLVATMRSWFAGPDAAVPAWLRVQDDPVVGPAVRLLQGDPAHPWTVATLAARLGMSRAALARRFQLAMGEPPIAFLTGWRLSLAADLLSDDGATLERVARQVGYSTPFALSTAYKRRYGVSPRRQRAQPAPTATDG